MPATSRPEAPSPESHAWRAPLATGGRAGECARELERLEDKLHSGERITPEEGLYLHEHADLLSLGRMADHRRWAKHPSARVSYIVDRNLNPTNVCITDCGFCAFYRRPGAEGAYVLERDEIHRRVHELADQGGRQILMQGGHHPYLKTDWWCELIADLRARWPEINCHGLSAPELDHLSKLDKRPVEAVIAQLVEAGLGSVPGAGAEILVERVRARIAPKKTSSARWLEIHRRIHEAGLRSSATMMFGHVETPAERIQHLEALRQLQDETGGFTAFACWTLQPEGVPERELYPTKASAAVYLRVQALSRIYLDNFDNIQTSYVTQGLKTAQVTLRFGCNDFGGTMLEENVVSAAGCFHLESIERIERVIERAGFAPARRNSWYGIVDSRCPSEGPMTREQAAPMPRDRAGPMTREQPAR